MNTHRSRNSQGFTVIELLVIIVIALTASVLVFLQQNDLRAARYDDQRKTAVNAIYYNLEEVYFKKHGSYPATINSSVLPAMDPELLTDTNGVKPTQEIASDADVDPENRTAAESELPADYEYRYEPTNCDDQGNCKSYSIHVTLAKEADYVKTSRNR